jgi:hypothetical protein
MASRVDPRHEVRLRVELAGVDYTGHRFKQTVFTHDISSRGARLEHTPPIIQRASVVEVHHRGRKARFRVVWVSGMGDQVGLVSLDERSIWGKPSAGTSSSQRRDGAKLNSLILNTKPCGSWWAL